MSLQNMIPRYQFHLKHEILLEISTFTFELHFFGECTDFPWAPFYPTLTQKYLTLPSVLPCPLQVGSGLDTAVFLRLLPPSANLTTRGWVEPGSARALKIEIICSHFSRLSILVEKKRKMKHNFFYPPFPICSLTLQTQHPCSVDWCPSIYE